MAFSDITIKAIHRFFKGSDLTGRSLQLNKAFTTDQNNYVRTYTSISHITFTFM